MVALCPPLTARRGYPEVIVPRSIRILAVVCAGMNSAADGKFLQSTLHRTARPADTGLYSMGGRGSGTRPHGLFPKCCVEVAVEVPGEITSRIASAAGIHGAP